MHSHTNHSHSHTHGDEETGCFHHHEAKEEMNNGCTDHHNHEKQHEENNLDKATSLKESSHHDNIHYESVDNHKIALDGRVGKSNEGVAGHPTRRRSSFYVKGICCKSEVPQVTSILRGSSTEVHNVSINVTARMVYVDHCTEHISAIELANALNSEGFGAKVTKDGAISHASNNKPHELNLEFANFKSSSCCSNGECHRDNIATEATPLVSSKNNAMKFVESTILIPQLATRKECDDVEKIVLEISNNDGECIRLAHANLASRTVKVEHNPKKMNAEYILHALQEKYSSYDAISLITDGEKDALYLPMSIEVSSSELTERKRLLPVVMGVGLEVIISGIFWVVSMFGRFVEKWSYLKYSGIIAVAFGIPSVAMKALYTLQRRNFDANCMMVTAALGSLLMQEYDEAASVSFLFAISEFLEDRATHRATEALDSIIKMRPDHANVINPENNQTFVIPAESLQIGDLVRVRTGDKIPSDGIVVEGSSHVDESSLTGESIFIPKSPGDKVSGGTINVGLTQMIIQTTSLVEDSAVSRLVRLVEESAANTSPTEQIVDSFARSYTPTVIVIAFFMCTIPWLISPEAGRRWTLNGLIIVVIACPCALTISTPVTYAAGLAATAQKGIIVKGGAKLEALGNVKTVVFDKTGTLTEGKFHLTHLDAVGGMKDRREVLSLLSTMEAPSSHPLAATLVNAAKAEGIEQSANAQVADHTILHGEGVQAMVNGEQVYVGNVRLFERLGMYDALNVVDRRRAESWNEEGGTVGFLGLDGVGIVGMFCVSDVVRSEAASVVGSLMKDEVKVLMLTGDGEGAAISVAEKVGLPLWNVKSRLTPDAKFHCIASELGLSKRSGGLFSKKELLMFVGDGVNDAPALSLADIGVAMGEGAALAMEMSDVTLMDSKLDKLLFSIQMGTKVVMTVQENILFSVFAKLVVIGLTFAGKMTLLGAIASDVGVMLLVSLNGMKLLPGGFRCCGKRRQYSQLENQTSSGELV